MSSVFRPYPVDPTPGYLAGLPEGSLITIKVPGLPPVVVGVDATGFFSMSSTPAFRYTNAQQVTNYDYSTQSPDVFEGWTISSATGGNRTITLPFQERGRVVRVKATGNGVNTVTLISPDGKTIDGAPNYVIPTLDGFVELICYNDWLIIGKG